jgi:hypothetical protein
MLKKTGPIGFIRSILHILAGKPQVPPSLEDNELLHTILRRRSVRRFAGREIPEDVFSAILEAGRLAPSTVNLQTWAFAVFSGESWAETFGRPIPFKGKRAVIIMGDTHRGQLIAEAFPSSPLVEYTVAVINASLAAMNMCIAAEAVTAGRGFPLNDRYLWLLPRAVPGYASQAAVGTNMLRGEVSRSRRRGYGGLAGADGGGLQGPKPAFLL